MRSMAHLADPHFHNTTCFHVSADIKVQSRVNIGKRHAQEWSSRPRVDQAGPHTDVV